jgi:hypothetical protein
LHLIIHSSHINNDMFYLSSHNPVLSSFIIYYRVWSRVIRQVPHVEQELLTLPLYMSSLRFLVWLVLLDLWFSVDSFVDHYLSLFCHCIVCPSSICGFWLSFDILKLFSHSKCCCLYTYFCVRCLLLHPNRSFTRISFLTWILLTHPI